MESFHDKLFRLFMTSFMPILWWVKLHKHATDFDNNTESFGLFLILVVVDLAMIIAVMVGAAVLLARATGGG